MQQKEIKYTGITTRPDDYNCPDGDLAAMHNLINEDGSIKPLALPEHFFTCPPGQKLAYIHRHAKYENYIFIKNEHEVLACPAADLNATEHVATFPADVTIIDITAMGNMLLILTSAGMYYVLYSNESYLLLGNKLPELPQYTVSEECNSLWTDPMLGQFNKILDSTIHIGTMTKGAWDKVNGETKNYDSEASHLINEYFSLIYEKAEQHYSDNYFIFPFFLRLAYRMYDGSLVCHSNPILALSDYRKIILGTYDKTANNNTIDIDSISIAGFNPSRVDIKFDPVDLGNWKEVITAVEVFISQPLYTINLGANEFFNITADRGNQQAFTNIKLELKDDVTAADFTTKVKDNRNFYKVESIKIEKFESAHTFTIPAKHMARNTLPTQETMTDDYSSRNIKYARGMYVYNNRLNLFNNTAGHFTGYTPQMFDIFKTRPQTGTPGAYQCKVSDAGTTQITIFIKDSVGTTSVVKGVFGGTYKMPRYFYYPWAQAFKVVFTSGGKSKEFLLEEHTGLNGAHYLNTDFEEEEVTEGYIATTASKEYTQAPNQIKLSEPGNPLVFQAANTYTVGSGRVLAISSATRALSQGQFGQFPLYAFTTEGVWALEVSATGTYAARQPATRDVCNNPHSITQLDGAIAFTTNQGLMLLAGAESRCISHVIDNQYRNTISLPKLEKINLGGLLQPTIPLGEYLKECIMAYDYPHSRILVINPRQSYLYVYSIKSGTWSILNDSFAGVLNAYPDSYLLRENGEVVSAAANPQAPAVHGLIITRPLKLDAPDALKTITQAIHRGIFVRGKVSTVLYGSRDYVNYLPIASSTQHLIRSIHGSPYKAFVFVIIVSGFTEEESLSGTSLLFDAKFTNKLR